MTQTHGARAARRPCTTAPPRPPMRRLADWGSSTISRVLRPAAASTTSAVPSVLASTKMISIATVGSTASRRSISASTLPRSFLVGTTIERRGSSRRIRPADGTRRCAQGFAYRRGRVRRQGRSSVPEKS